MPGVYRSKSYRRYEDNSPITTFIERDNNKILATASAQLFISAPHIEKWFKSSTGTICFLKNFTTKCSYYFRLYSLMQGQLWEQEMQSPFDYIKANNLFHYLTLNRFNYGFKFICEDEAERFFNVVRKFSTQMQVSLQQQPTQVSLSSLDVNTNNETITMATTVGGGGGVNETTTTTIMATSSSENKPLLLNWLDSAAAQLSKTTRQSRFTATTAASGSTNSGSSSTTSAGNSNSTNANGSGPNGASNSNSSTSQPKSRRFAVSSDRGNNASGGAIGNRASSAKGKKPIEKSDISCPFRCSCVDLSGNGTDDANNGEIQQKGSTEMIKKYSTVVKELAQMQDKPSGVLPTNNEQVEMAARKLLIRHNYKSSIVDRKLIQSISEYIMECGGLKKFEEAHERSENERKKFSAFLAASVAISRSPKNNNSTTAAAIRDFNKSSNDVSTTSESSRRDAIIKPPIDMSNKDESNKHYNSILRNSPNTPSVSQTINATIKSINNTLKTPTTMASKPQLTTTKQQQINIGVSNTYLLTPPKSATIDSTAAKNHNLQRTPTTQTTTTSYTPIRGGGQQYYRSRALTPSVSPPQTTSATKSSLKTLNTSSTSSGTQPQHQHVARINMLTAASSSGGLDVPPKPPRRSSLRINY